MVSAALEKMIVTETADKAVYAPLVEPTVLIGSGVVYVIVALLLHRIMRDRSPFSLKQSMRIYNVVQVAVCSYMTIGFVKEIMNASPLIINGISLPNVFALNYAPTLRSEYFVLVHYLSKFLDFFDTLFIVLRKKDKQFSFLHVYHHATIGPIWGMLLYLNYGSGTAIFGAMINSFTHVIMYTHYFVTSFGIKNPLKRYITTWQIFQFYCCLAHAVMVALLRLDNVYPQYLAILQLCYHITMVLLFNSFFQRTFTKPTEAETNGKHANGHANGVTNGNSNGNGVSNGSVRRRRVASD
eukprot:TRINITY_DN3689_c0_g1_i1.p1 TRINITY_DN3689_c0_g1~~TRINITY_DN3689_c0_g1_i1.p1  ORF type:complete len:297 (+),score=50.52 TRINITY_DN3689_c0_g1_i1:67-957(+)